MDSEPVVFDISSDEEGCWGENNKGVVSDERRDGGDFDNLDWLSELLEVEVTEKEKERDSDDSDDVVVVVSEVLVKNPKQQREKKPKVYKKDMDDDDCVILDGDPDKAGVVEKKDDNTGAESDDLVIVGEKGQIACRDYPHSRHLCATYPFASTSHDTHCQQCHCYVCDSLAPCAHWGNGTSNIHHCHATDKDEFWKLQRKNFRQGVKAPVPRLPDPSLSIRPNPSFRAPVGNSHQPYVPTGRIHLSKSTTIRACSTASSIVGIGQDRSQQPGQVMMSRNKYQPHLVSQQLDNVSRRDRAVNPYARLGPRYNSQTPFKRTGLQPVVGSATSRPVYRSSANNNEAEQRFRSLSSSVSSGVSSRAYQNAYQQVGSFRDSVLPSLPSFVSAAAAPSLQAVSQPNMSNLATQSHVPSQQPKSTLGTMPTQSHVSSSIMGNNLGNPVSSQSEVSSSQRSMRIKLYSSNRGNSFATPQSQVSSHQPIVGPNFISPTYLQSQAESPYRNMESSFVNQLPSPRELYDQTTPAAENYDVPDPGFSGSDDAGWGTFVDPNQEQPVADNPSAVQSYDDPAPFVTAGYEPCSVNSNPLEFQYDSWMAENSSGGGFDVGSSASGLNMYSPEVDPISLGGGNFLF